MVVLPLLPVSAATLGATCSRTIWPNRPKAIRLSLTMICGISTACFFVTIAAMAPCAAAVATKPLASKLSPLKAINKSPALIVRVSVDTAVITISSPCHLLLSCAAIALNAKLIIVGYPAFR